MKPDRDHLHAQFGTRHNLLTDQRFTQVIEEAETFCGAPFTLCRCSALGKDTINLTGLVRNKLWEGRWVPDSGFVELGVLAPADGLWFSIDMKLPLEPAHLAEIHYRLDNAYVEPAHLEATVAFFKKMAIWSRAEYGYVHPAADEVVQDTVDANIYRSLTGMDPPLVPIDPRNNPGRSVWVGQHLITCRWLSYFGGELAASIGRARLLDAPCHHENLEGRGILLRLYDDPLSCDRPEQRAIQSSVRSHLRLDELAETFPSRPAEQRPSQEVAPPAESTLPDASTPRTPSLRRSEPAEENLLWLWAETYDRAFYGLPGEEQFYTDMARRGAGKVLKIGCATGRILIPVARTGVPVVGVDQSPQAIAQIRSQLQKEPSALQGRTTLLLGDVRHLDLSSHGPFAAVLMPYRQINRFTEVVQLRQLLRTVRDHLRPGGVLAFSTFFPRAEWCQQDDRLVPKLVSSGQDPAGQGRYLLYDTVEADPMEQRMTVHRHLLIVDDRGEVVGQRFHTLQLRYFFPRELQYLLELTGFKAVIQGGFQKSQQKDLDQEVVVVAERI
ncbi:MAG: class I SAM-dependent methyltransferase [Bradymonadales bacterium]|nr:class I SAM-dependent methyltransferase [Bradymonadales bacterium]